MYTPEHLSLWSLPSSYYGAEWRDYYVFLGRSRDSDCLEESNFHTALAAIGGETGEDDDGISMVTVVKESHWAVGWVEWIAIHKTNETALREADKMKARLENYPVLDEDDWSEREMEAANETWTNCYNEKERVEYIREHRSQFDFNSFSDLLAVVRGRYFNGYASDLLS